MSEAVLEKHPKAIGIVSGGFFVAGGLDIAANLHYVSNHMISMNNILLFAGGVVSFLSGGCGVAISIAELKEQAKERRNIQVMTEWNQMGPERRSWDGTRFRQLPRPPRPRQLVDNPPRLV